MLYEPIKFIFARATLC